MAVKRDNPYLNFNFIVDIGVGDELGFSEVEAAFRRDRGDRVPGGRRQGQHRAQASRPRQVPERHAQARDQRGTDLFEWWKSVRDGQVQRRNVTITLLDEQRQAVYRWLLRNAWPVKIEGPALNASGNEVAIETLELAHEGLEIE